MIHTHCASSLGKESFAICLTASQKMAARISQMKTASQCVSGR
jgi:hypothetical protein